MRRFSEDGGRGILLALAAASFKKISHFLALLRCEVLRGRGDGREGACWIYTVNINGTAIACCVAM